MSFDVLRTCSVVAVVTFGAMHANGTADPVAPAARATVLAVAAQVIPEPAPPAPAPALEAAVVRLTPWVD